MFQPLTGERNELLVALSAETKALLDPHLKHVAIERGATLHEPGGDIAYVYFPVSGMIMLAVVMLTGEVIGTATVGREGAIGTKAGFIPSCAYTRALVQISGSAERISATAFRAVLDESAELRAAIAGYTDGLVAQIHHMSGCYALHTVEARFCGMLLAAADRTDGREVPMTQDALAQTLGAHRGTVNLLLRRLHRAGALRSRRNMIELVDSAHIERLSCECHHSLRMLRSPSGA